MTTPGILGILAFNSFKYNKLIARLIIFEWLLFKIFEWLISEIFEWLISEIFEWLISEIFEWLIFEIKVVMHDTSDIATFDINS